MDAGQPLRGNLTGCNRLKNNRMGLRVIFREIKDTVEVIQIVAIGKRDSNKVYDTPSTRLK